MSPYLDFENNLVGYIGLFSGLAATIAGAHYLFRQRRDSWGWIVLLIGIIGLLANEITGIFAPITPQQIFPGHLNWPALAGGSTSLNDLLDIFSELCIGIGFWQLFVVEQDREKRKVQQLERRADGLESLSSSIMGISESLKLSTVLEAVARGAQQLLDADVAVIGVTQDGLHYQVYQALAPKQQRSKIRADERLLQQTFQFLVQQGDILALENLSAHPAESRYRGLIPAPIQAVIAMPLFIDEKPMGAIYLGFLHPQRFGQTERYLLHLFANQTSLSIRNAALYRHVETLSLSDPLTGLGNRRAFEQHLREEMHRSRRYKHDLAVIMVDIDHFKYVNDHYGHPVGDRVIKGIADILQASLREVDFAARMGGDEFMFILPETNQAEALATAERVRIMIENTPIRVDHQAVQITASLGSISFTAQEIPDHYRQVYEMADQALYKAKALGRNRVEV